jgi:hypothetical protein
MLNISKLKLIDVVYNIFSKILRKIKNESSVNREFVCALLAFT